VLVGPLAAGILIATAGPAAAFGFNAFTFVVAFAGVYTMRLASAAPGATGSILSQIVDGVRFTFSLSWLWITIVGFAFVVAAYVAAWTGLPILVRDAFAGDATTFGFISAASGVGELLGAVVIGQLPYRRVGVVMYLYTALFGLGIAGIGAAPILPIVLAFAALTGICVIGLNVPWYSALQRHVPREYLGRVSSVDMFGGSLLAPIAPVLGGVLVSDVGAAPVFGASGVLIAVFGLAGLAVPSIRRLR
jgi:DHA3 family tetracycline resistance protein-like MFS transporter